MAEEASGVRAAIAHDRAELADTVQALVQKTDVKERVRATVTEKAEELHQRAGEVGERLRNATPEDAQDALGAAAQRAKQQPVVLALVGVFVLGILIGRMRTHHRGH
jgi:hypothetical protein